MQLGCAGAKLLAGGDSGGGHNGGNAWLEDVPRDCEVMQSEVFGPVLILERYAVFRDAIKRWTLLAGACCRERVWESQMSCLVLILGCESHLQMLKREKRLT